MQEIFCGWQMNDIINFNNSDIKVNLEILLIFDENLLKVQNSNIFALY